MLASKWLQQAELPASAGTPTHLLGTDDTGTKTELGTMAHWHSLIHTPLVEVNMKLEAS